MFAHRFIRSDAVPWKALVAIWLIGAIVVDAGCSETAPPPADLSQTPWLDPNVQIGNLKSQDFRIRGLAAFHLGNLGAEAADALPALEKLAREDPNPKVKENAREAIEKIRAATGKSSE